MLRCSLLCQAGRSAAAFQALQAIENNVINQMRHKSAIMKNLQTAVFFLFLALAAQTYGQEKLKEAFIQKVDKAVAALELQAPLSSDPVSLACKAVWNDDKTQIAVVVKVKVLAGWHIYSYVPETQPYIQSSLILELPEGITAITEWTKPASYPFEDSIFVYEGEVSFIRYFTVKKIVPDAKIKAGMHYQTCDLRQCLPPDSKEEELTITK